MVVVVVVALLVVAVGAVGAVGDGPVAAHVPVPALTRTVPTLSGDCATPGLIRTVPNFPAQIREPRIPERNEVAILTG